MTLSNNDSSEPHHRHKVPFNERQLSTLVNMDSPEAVHSEVLHIIGLMGANLDAIPIERVFHFTLDLYLGRLDAYRACNTDYHNLGHITDTYLAMARLLHGALLSGEKFSDRDIFLGLTGALMHDAGMIQESSDEEGTGAKYTQQHVRLSMDFVATHGATLQIDDRETSDLRDMILCTDLMADIPAINFSRPTIELLGKMLGTADLIAQMADRIYLEKLLFLYHEFREAEIGTSKSEIDFLNQTKNFFEISEKRFEETLDNTSRFMVRHFKNRWGIEENLYVRSLKNQRIYLEKILADKSTSVYQKLKRNKIVDQVREKFGKTGFEE